MSQAAELVLEKHRDYTGAKIGMWLFLFTELLLFGGMFILYAAYRANHGEAFHKAAMELNTLIGTINTFILLTSSLTMALSIVALQKKNKNASLLFLGTTIIFGILFLVIKYFEWSEKIGHGIYPNSEALQFYDSGEVLYFGLYFTMTGIHGLHVIIGVGILAFMYSKILKRPEIKFEFDPAQLDKMQEAKVLVQDKDGKNLWQSEKIAESIGRIIIQKASRTAIDKSNILKLENSGLYWHLVDIIWIFLFPLFYLIT